MASSIVDSTCCSENRCISFLASLVVWKLWLFSLVASMWTFDKSVENHYIKSNERHNTGVSNSYSAFHFSCFMTSISSYSNGRLSQTLERTPFASSHSEQFGRVNSVRRSVCRSRIAVALILRKRRRYYGFTVSIETQCMVRRRIQNTNQIGLNAKQ